MISAIKTPGKLVALTLAVLVLSLGGLLAGCGGAKKDTAAVNSSAQKGNQPTIAYDKAEGSGPPAVERKITREASLVIIVPEVEKAASRLEEKVTGAGGYIQQSSMWQAEGRTQCRMALRIPAEKLDGFLSGLEELGRVDSRNITGKDVTEEYYDTAARKATLERQEKRLLELLGKANSIKEMLEIENELTRIRGQVESLQARLKLLDSLTSMATVSVELRGPKGITAVETLKDPLGQRIQAAWNRGLHGAMDLAEGIILLSIMMIPYVPVLAVAGYLLHLFWKKRKSGK